MDIFDWLKRRWSRQQFALVTIDLVLDKKKKKQKAIFDKQIFSSNKKFSVHASLISLPHPSLSSGELTLAVVGVVAVVVGVVAFTDSQTQHTIYNHIVHFFSHNRTCFCWLDIWRKSCLRADVEGCPEPSRTGASQLCSIFTCICRKCPKSW